MCYFGTNNRFLIYASCVILSTGQRGTPHYSQPATEDWNHLTTLWGTWITSNVENHLGGCRCVIFDHIIQSRCRLKGETLNRPVRNAHYSQPATEERRLYGMIGHIKHWKQCLGALMCYFGTNNPFLIYASCVILPTGQWGPPHYSQPATEEWLHLTETSGTWNTLNIENHVWGPWCVISGQIIVCWCIHYVWHSQPASEERHITPNRPRRIGCIWQQYGARETHQTLKTMSVGPHVSFRNKKIVSWYIHYVWYSQPASEEHHIIPNRPLRNGSCMGC